MFTKNRIRDMLGIKMLSKLKRTQRCLAKVSLRRLKESPRSLPFT